MQNLSGRRLHSRVWDGHHRRLVGGPVDVQVGPTAECVSVACPHDEVVRSTDCGHERGLRQLGGCNTKHLVCSLLNSIHSEMAASGCGIVEQKRQCVVISVGSTEQV